MIAILVGLLILAMSSPVAAAALFATNNGLTSGTCNTSGTACRPDRVFSLAACGDTITFLNGTYQGAVNLIDFYHTAPAHPTCSSGSQMTVTTETEGSVFLDAQFARAPFSIAGVTYWNFSGFDAGNSGIGEFAGYIGGNGSGTLSDHVTVSRMCFSNTINDGTDRNLHVLAFSGVTNSTFEDICAFGWGRNTMLTEDTFGTNASNTFRRFWIRFEGYVPTAGSMTMQSEYYHTDSPALSGNHVMENFILVYSSEQNPTPTVDMTPALGRRLFSLPVARKGFISYGYTGATAANGEWWDEQNPSWVTNLTDIFVDGRSQSTQVFRLGCSAGGSNPDGTKCASNSADRLTAITSSATASTFGFSATTNTNECTTLASCPNFYTGNSPGTGARNCFRYVDGALTSTPLWPWPMDNRIKAALARAHAAGTGGTALDGVAGSGYAANTVTSEIVSRYGSIPTACLTGSFFTPSFPVASDFPSVSVRDDFMRANASNLGASWTELLSDTFSLVSNAAAAPSTGGAFARATYSDTKMQTDHEVYATWTILPATGGYTTFLSFAGTDLTANNQYRVRVNRTSSVNTLVEVQRIDGAGVGTVIMSGVDLGIEAVDTNSFGVRVSGTTISVYWKWTDGIWYRIGQFTDSNLSSLPSTGVYGGIAGGSPSVIDNYGAGPFVDQPVQNPPSPPPSVGVSRFGTTFPGVR